MQTKTRNISIKLIWAVENTENQIQTFEKWCSQAGNMTQCENH
jgi:hypothetical protein